MKKYLEIKGIITDKTKDLSNFIIKVTNKTDDNENFDIVVETYIDIFNIHTLLDTNVPYDKGYVFVNFKVENKKLIVLDNTIKIYNITEKKDFKFVNFTVDLQGIEEFSIASNQRYYNLIGPYNYASYLLTNKDIKSLPDFVVKDYLLREYGTDSYIEIYAMSKPFRDNANSLENYRDKIQEALKELFKANDSQNENRVFKQILESYDINRLLSGEVKNIYLYDIGIISNEVINAKNRSLELNQEFNKNFNYLVGILRRKFKVKIEIREPSTLKFGLTKRG